MLNANNIVNSEIEDTFCSSIILVQRKAIIQLFAVDVKVVDPLFITNCVDHYRCHFSCVLMCAFSFKV